MLVTPGRILVLVLRTPRWVPDPGARDAPAGSRCSGHPGESRDVRAGSDGQSLCSGVGTPGRVRESSGCSGPVPLLGTPGRVPVLGTRDATGGSGAGTRDTLGTPIPSVTSDLWHGGWPMLNPRMIMTPILYLAAPQVGGVHLSGMEAWNVRTWKIQGPTSLQR